MNSLEPAALAQAIDHTLLAADASREQIATLCAEAREHGFYSVCVNSSQVPFAARQLAGSAVKVCAVVGFPLGAGLSASKASEAALTIAAGAQEIDMVLNIGWLKDGLFDEVRDDIAAVLQACGSVPLKVIPRPACSMRRRRYAPAGSAATWAWHSSRPPPASAAVARRLRMWR